MCRFLRRTSTRGIYMSIRNTSLKVALATAALTLMAGASAQSDGPIQAPPSSNKAADSSNQGPKEHIIVFREAPLATYRGEIKGLAAPPRHANGKRKGRIDVKSAQAKAYVANLKSRQNKHENDLSSAVGHPIKVRRSMQHAINAVVADLTPAEADRISRDPSVLFVEAYREYALDTDAGPALIGAPSIWNNGTGLNPGQSNGTGPSQGEGIVFGILDTGINFASPSFSATDTTGYTHTNPLGAGEYLGTCAPGGADDGNCNDKLIGGFDFVCGAPANVCGTPGNSDEPSFVDNNGHGSHTASTAAGNRRIASIRGNEVPISGVAPRGNIVAYDICYTDSAGRGRCPNSSALAAVEQVIADGVVDVINYSISGGSAPWNEAVSIAFLNATDAGVYVAASAGNSGPGAGTLGHNEPWVSSTAAATHDRQGFEFVLSVTGPTPVPAPLTTVLLTPGGNGVSFDTAIPGSTPMAFASTNGCAPFASGAFQGAIAVIRRGGCAFTTKTNNASAAGAIAVVIANNGPGAISPSVPGTSIPVFGIFQADGDAIQAFAAANPGTTTAGIGYPALRIPGVPDVLASFSSRGPAAFDVLKPDVTAPGVQILAAVAGAPEAVGLYNGTSMSSPHQAGAAGLLRQLHPGWSVPEVKSALAMTAEQDVLLEDGVTPADAFAKGSGRIQVDRAARSGLVMHETGGNYYNAFPGFGGDPSTLNQPSMARGDCTGGCSFTRVFRSTLGKSQEFDVSLEGLAGSVSLKKFNIKANGGQSLTVTIDSSDLPNGGWNFGTLVLRPKNAGSGNASPTLRLPIAVSVPAPIIPFAEFANLAGVAGSSQTYNRSIPAGWSSMVVKTTGGTGDADLYVFNGAGSLVCRSENAANEEICIIPAPAAGTWYFQLGAYQTFSGVTLTVGYTE